MFRLISLSALLLALAGCATTSAPPASVVATRNPTAATPTTPSAAPAARPQGAPTAGTTSPSPAGPGASPPLRPFADLVKDAKETKGLFTLYEKEDKVYLELAPEQLGQLYFLQLNLERGLPDERALSARRMVGSQVVVFKRLHNTLQLLARNYQHYGTPGTPLARAVENMTSDSLLASVPVVSLPHPERKSFLVEANALFFADMMNVGQWLERGFRSGYTFDARNSHISAVRSTPTTTSVTVQAHYQTPRLPMPAATSTPSPQPPASPTRSTPDPRSFFLGLHYSLARLPEVPMRPRVADPRIGHFHLRLWDYSNTQEPFTRQYIVRRWRLERPDGLVGTDTLAEPKQPITFWIDKSVPLEYRDAVREGVLEWNKAFERIGFKNAIVVKQQEDNDESNLNDTMRASIHWFVDYNDGALAVGPSVSDPRTGEILDADISIGAGWARLPRRQTRDQFLRPPVPTAQFGLDGLGHVHDESCQYAQAMFEEARFAMDLLELRGALSYDSPQALAIAQNVVKGVVTHEVGHALGLRHNFRASTVYTLAQMSDPAFVARHGLTGSVMDYVPFNIALKGETQGPYYSSALGPYDYWAIEYAYKEFPPEQEKAGLAAIAHRSGEPLLAYATDEEVRGDGDGMDPEVNQRDLGPDTIAYAKRRLALSRELWESALANPPATGESYTIQRRRLELGLNAVETALGFVAKYVGGVTYLRDHAGTGRANFNPVPASRQREALQLLTEIAFKDEVFRFPPEFMSRVPADSLDTNPASEVQAFGERFTTPSLPERVARMQRGLLDRLLSDKVAQRVLEAPTLLKDSREAMPLHEIYETIEDAVWSDVAPGRELSPARRALQREHARRIAAALTRPAPASYAAEARALHRLSAKRLVSKLDQALRGGALSVATRAHLDEMRDQLQAALQAVAQRAMS